jgi:hypothetical protein
MLKLTPSWSALWRKCDDAVFELGDAFLAGQQVHGTSHLWIVINDPKQHADTALFVNVTTLTSISEKTCTLRAGEHPFITHASCIRFASAKIALVTELDTLESCKLIARKQRATAALVAKIRAAAQASPFLPQKCLRLM